MAGEALLATRFAALGLLLLLAAWLLWVRFTHPVNRAFALLLALLALQGLAFRLRELTGAGYWDGLAGYFALGIVPATAYFLLVYAGPPRLAASRARWAPLLAGAALLLAYALDHCAFRCIGPAGAPALGPLALVGYADGLAYGAVGAVLARRFARGTDPAGRRGHLLASAAFVLLALLALSIPLGVLARRGLPGLLGFFAPGPWAAGALALTLLAVVPVAAALALYARHARAMPEGTDRRLGLAAAGALATGLAVGLWPEAYAPVGSALLGVWQLVFLGLVVVAIVRHQLFDLDVRLRWTVKQSTVAAVFIGTFFIVGEAAQSALSESLGPYLGIAAAGLLVFALAPLQHAAERLARSAVPAQPPAAEVRLDRVASFRAAVELALADGVVNRAEERALARLAAELGLDPAEALRVREEAARGAGDA